ELLQHRVRAGFNGGSGGGGRLGPSEERNEKKNDDKLQLTCHDKPQQKLKLLSEKSPRPKPRASRYRSKLEDKLGAELHDAETTRASAAIVGIRRCSPVAALRDGYLRNARPIDPRTT